MKDKWWGFYTQLSEGECCKPGASTKCGPATYFGPWSFVQNKIIKGHNVFKCKYKSFTTEKQADEFMRYGPEGKQNATKSTESITNDTTKVFIDWSLKSQEDQTENSKKRKAPEIVCEKSASRKESFTSEESEDEEYDANIRIQDMLFDSETETYAQYAKRVNTIVILQIKKEISLTQRSQIAEDRVQRLLKNQTKLIVENQELTKTIKKLKNTEPKTTEKNIEPILIIQNDRRSPPNTPPTAPKETKEVPEDQTNTTIDKLVCYVYAFNATNQNGGFGLFFPDHKTFTTSQPVDRLKLQCDDMTQLKWKGEFSTLEAIHQALMLAERVGAKSVLIKLRNDMSEKHLTKLWLSEVWKGKDWQRKFETSLSNKILGLMGVIATEFEVVEAEKELDLLDIADQLAVVGSAMSFV